MKELIDQFDLIALPLSYHLICTILSSVIRNDRTDKMCVCDGDMIDRFRDFILFY